MVWVKGELLTGIDAAGIDPSEQLTRVAQPVMFDRQDWFARVTRHAVDKAAPLIARAASEGSLAWLFLARQPGGGADALGNWYTLAFRPVFAGNPDDPHKRAMLTAIAKRLGRVRPRIGVITLAPVPRADGTSALITRAFGRSGWACFTNQSSTSWTANVKGMTFADYWAERPGQLRSTFARKRAKAAFETKIYDHYDAAAWADYEAIYADSWKPDEGAPAFLKETAQAEGATGCLRLGICRIDGVAVAAQFWTVENGTAYIHKLAHRDSAKALSPGTILSAALFEHVIDSDLVNVIDFGTGDDSYKADWMDSSQPLDCIRLFNIRTPRGLVGAARAWLATLVRRVRGR